MGALIIVFFSTSNGTNTVMGVLFMIFAVVSGVLFTIFSRKSSKHFSAMEITYLMVVVATIVFNGINIVKHIHAHNLSTYFQPLCDKENIIGFIFLSVLSSIIATAMNNYAFGKIQASSCAAVGGLSVIISVAAGVILNHEQLYAYHYISIILIVIASVGIGIIGEKNRDNNAISDSSSSDL